MPYEIRAALAGEPPHLLALWHEAAEPTSTDDVAGVTALIARDPGALLVALDGEALVGSVVAGWDGWRGSIYRLAVAPSYRRRGLGRELVRAAEGRLRALGARRLQAVVISSDERAMGFWSSSGWVRQAEWARFVLP
jgi:ribosomal protein S18 acetylase RimI-like enzyme